VIAFEMAVLDELRDRMSEVPLADGNNLVEAFFLDRPHESLGIGIGVRRALRCQDHPDAGVAQPLSHRTAPFPIPIADQHTLSEQHAVLRRRHETHHLAHEELSRMWRGTQHVDEARSMTNTV